MVDSNNVDEWNCSAVGGSLGWRVDGRVDGNEMKICIYCGVDLTDMEAIYIGHTVIKGETYYIFCCEDCAENNEHDESGEQTNIDKFKKDVGTKEDDWPYGY